MLILWPAGLLLPLQLRGVWVIVEVIQKQRHDREEVLYGKTWARNYEEHHGVIETL